MPVTKDTKCTEIRLGRTTGKNGKFAFGSRLSSNTSPEKISLSEEIKRYSVGLLLSTLIDLKA